MARSLKLPLNPAEAARVIATGDVRHIDVARVNEQYFFNVAHIGLGAETQRQLTPEHKRRWRVFSYPLAMLQSLVNHKPFVVQLEVDGKRKTLLAIQVAVGNGRFYGGGMPVADQASIADALLDIHCIRPGGGLSLLRSLAALWRGSPGPKSVWRAQGRHIEVRPRKRRRITADGEEVGHTPAIIDVLPGAVPMLGPHASSRMENTHVS